MKTHLIWLVPLALAGCKKNTVEVQNATAAQVAEEIKKTNVVSTEIQPGLWSATMKIDNVTVPGSTPAMRQKMRSRLGQPKTMTDCLTEEKAKKPFDSFVQGISSDCRYDHFAMGKGKLDSTLVCSKDDVTHNLAVQGTYDPTHYRIQMITTGSGGRMNGVEITMSLEAHRTGDCPKS